MTRDYARNYRPQAKPRNTRVAPTTRSAPGWVWLLAGALIGSLVTGVLLFNKDAATVAPPVAETGDNSEVVEEAAPPPSHKPRFDFYTLLKETEVLVPDENGQMPTKTVVIPDAKDVAADTKAETPTDGEAKVAETKVTEAKLSETKVLETKTPAIKAAESKPGAPAQTPPATTAVAEKPADKPAPTPQPASPQPTAVAAPPPSPPPATPAPATTPPPAQSQFVLQAGSFKNASDADSVRARLLLLNMHATVERVSANGNETWHRVMIGPFANPDDATRASTLLRQNGIDSIQVKRRN